MKPAWRLFQDYFSWSGLILLGLTLLSLCTGPSLAAEPAAETAWQATYRGSLVPQKEEDGNFPQPFTLQVVVSQLAANQWQLDWALQESGRAQWPWPSQYGSVTWQEGVAVDPKSSGPGLLHPHDERKSIVRFPSFEVVNFFLDFFIFFFTNIIISSFFLISLFFL